MKLFSLSPPPVVGIPAGVCEGHDVDFLTGDAVDDPEGIALDELAAVTLTDVFPELWKGFDFLTRLPELVEKICRDVSGSFLVKGDRFEDFQFGFVDIAQRHRCKICWILASSSSELEALLSPASKRATRASYSVISSGASCSPRFRLSMSLEVT